MSVTLSISGEKRQGLLRKLEQSLKSSTEKISIRVPRYSLTDDDNQCLFCGVPCEILTKNTCCVLVELPVKQLYEALRKEQQ